VGFPLINQLKKYLIWISHAKIKIYICIYKSFKDFDFCIKNQLELKKKLKPKPRPLDSINYTYKFHKGSLLDYNIF